MTLPVQGLVHITGEPDTGKTTLALTVPGVQPSDIIFFDDDKKTQSIADSFVQAGSPFGYYVNLARESNANDANKPLDFYKLVLKHLEKARQACPDAKVLVCDNFDRFEYGVRAYSMTIMEKISDLTPGQIRGMSQLTWPHTFTVYAQFLDQLNNIAPLVFIITHTRPQYVGNVKTNLLESRGQKPLIEKANLRIWTRHNPTSPAPVGLILKRIQKMQVTAEGIKTINVLPRRVAPCTWEKIIRYLNQPVGDRDLTLDETPTPFELSILDGVLTEDQKDAWRVARITAEREAATEDMLPDIDPDVVKAKDLQQAGYKPPQIAEEMGKTVPEVIALLK